MNKKISISIIAVTLLAIGGGILYGYLSVYLVGFHNGRLVVHYYFCSDVCPSNDQQNYGSWVDAYFGVRSKEKCEKIGGRFMIDPAWGGFIGCALIREQ